MPPPPPSAASNWTRCAACGRPQVLKMWRETASGGDGKAEITPEDLRKVRAPHLWPVETRHAAAERFQQRRLRGRALPDLRTRAGGRAGSAPVRFARFWVVFTCSQSKANGMQGVSRCPLCGFAAPPPTLQVLVKQGSKLSLLVVIQIFLDIGAAYGALVAGAIWTKDRRGVASIVEGKAQTHDHHHHIVMLTAALADQAWPSQQQCTAPCFAGNFLGEASLQYGVPAVVLQAVACECQRVHGSGQQPSFACTCKVCASAS